MPLLKLPRELRNLIYAQVGALDSPPSDYKGLYLSCKQTKAEYTEESQLALKQRLSQLHQHAGIRAESAGPSDLSPTSDLQLSLSTRVFNHDFSEPGAPLSADMLVLQTVVTQYFNCVVFRYHADGGGQFSRLNLDWILRYTMRGGIVFRSETVHAREIIFEVPLHPHGIGSAMETWTRALDDIPDHYRNSMRKLGWVKPFWLINRRAGLARLVCRASGAGRTRSATKEAWVVYVPMRAREEAQMSDKAPLIWMIGLTLAFGLLSLAVIGLVIGIFLDVFWLM
jgi:hypothetical protein